MAAISSVQCLFSCDSHHHQLVQSGSLWRLGSRVLVSSSLWKRSQFSRGDSLRRRNLICAVKGDAEGAFKKTVAIDRMIDALQDANPRELEQLVVENILAFDEVFWIRLAARSDTCKSDDDKKDYEELAATVMSIVDCVVNKTREKIETSTDVLKGILRPVVEGVEEISWPPRDPEAINQMENEIIQREKEGQLDEGFLSEVSAQLRQAKEDKEKPGLAAMLQKVLQLYAATILSKRSYAKKGNEVVKAEYFLETLIKGTLSLLICNLFSM
ncbi:hypothetical protein EUTSA_v10000241mg [Eutrema salsugineum]|uniref:Uncharacterized protein n=1 Tax=Eutrema salsugineum TaxID=72664 RepID=V4NII0_EUTSA|nr:hypothetical protein EUTSA_v10000241mg [Eutrema salsugineum]